jgi:hypothetical protein
VSIFIEGVCDGKRPRLESTLLTAYEIYKRWIFSRYLFSSSYRRSHELLDSYIVWTSDSLKHNGTRAGDDY